MKRTNGRVGIGLVLVSLLVGACPADRDKSDASAEALAQPEAALPGAMDPKGIVFAVRSQLDRAFGGAKFALPDAKATVRTWDAFNDVGAVAKSSVEFLGNAAITGERGKVAADITLPARADGVFRLRDELSGVAIDVGLEGATASARAETNGYVVYPGGYANGAHIVHRPTANGTEDYVFFSENLPQTPELRYKVKLGDGVAGLRLVEQTVEMLDSGGAPRLRMAPPYAIDGDGRRLAMNVTIEGCAYDTSLALPWDRPTVDPGARECTVRLSWSGDAKAPLVVDPVWSLTGEMIKARQNSTASGLPTIGLNTRFRVIVVGGDQGTPASALDSTELFDDSTNTWTAGPPLTTPRTEHSMVAMPMSGAVGSLYVIGGRDATTVLKSMEKLVSAPNEQPIPAAWMHVADMNTPRAQAAAIPYGDGRILVSGGIGTANVAISSVESFDGNAGWVTAQSMGTPRVGHVLVSAPPVPMGSILKAYILGGKDDLNMPLKSIERCDQSTTGMVTCTSIFEGTTPLGSMKIERVNPVAFYDTINKKIHTIGGEGLKSAECYILETNTSGYVTGSMATERAFFTVTQFPGQPYKHLIVGGVDSSGNVQKTTEIYDVVGGKFLEDLKLTTPRARHNTIFLPDKRPLVIGGALGNVGTAETLHCASNAECPPTQYCSNLGICENFKLQGSACDMKTDCWDGECMVNVCVHDQAMPVMQCVDGFCCNSDCPGLCEACDGPNKGTCSPIEGPPHDQARRGICKADEELSDKCIGECDGFTRTLEGCKYPVGQLCLKECIVEETTLQSTLRSLTCTAEGLCKDEILALSCGNYTCMGTDSCNKKCDDMDGTNDCITGYRCNAETNSCVEAQFQCGTMAVGDAGTQEVVESVTEPPVVIAECGGFKCNPMTVQCLTTCGTAYDCAAGFTCDTNHVCVPETGQFDTETVSCSMSPARESSRSGWLAAFALAGMIAARRNRARA